MANRTLIFGNIGAGKSALAIKISSITGQKHIELDELAWHDEQHSIAEKMQFLSSELQHLNTSGNWVAEGVFGQSLSRLLVKTTQVIFLDMPLPICLQQLDHRYKDELHISDLERQKLWATSYYHRETANSYAYHNELFDSFSGYKIRISDAESLMNFCAQLKRTTSH
ncbi:hypothetical protein HC752_08285 [Vibrio sp. S9_S30]|uniref:hypothetical protein n=1 Tax=Vibrio sp. S9_S30 TaxID=2720226 RepID=UPI001681A4F3|nr:hypothetical protein [Vibrio sp. S9_S30]MBD1556932.1 hypothetical protein [Vibrio sp. S9_S30]